MTTLELIYEKAQTLDAPKLEALYEFIKFLARQDTGKQKIFPISQLETPDQPSVYVGKPLSITDMDAAIEFEAGIRK